MSKLDDFVPFDDALKFLQIPEKRARQLVEDGQLDLVDQNGAVGFRRARLQGLLDGMRYRVGHLR